MVAVEHNNLAVKEDYHGKRLVYFGNYLKSSDYRFGLSKDGALKLYLPYMKKINSKFDLSWIEAAYFNKALYAQPIVDCNYYKTLPEIRTPIENVYVATMAQVYPWDRGTNYAVELGKKVARLIL